jgi:hypothetical protein
MPEAAYPHKQRDLGNVRTPPTLASLSSLPHPPPDGPDRTACPQNDDGHIAQAR